jgi:multidrug efflux pump subunit AcrA (membrane-fusion protein)
VDATVDESNVVKLKQGMPVTVTFDSLPGQTFQGTVATVTPSGTTQQGVVTFPVTVVFNTQGFTIPPGTTASLRVITERKENVLAVPSRAVSRQGRQSFVTVTVDGKTGKAVQTGITGDNFTEIVSGLEEGETIVTSQTGGTGQQGTGTFGAGGLGTSGAPAGGPVIIPPGRALTRHIRRLVVTASAVTASVDSHAGMRLSVTTSGPLTKRW